MPRFRCPSCRKMLDLDDSLGAEEIFSCPGCKKSCRLPRSLKSKSPSEASSEADEDVLDVVATDSSKHSSSTRTRQRDETDEQDALDVVEPIDEEGSRSRRGDSHVRRRDEDDYDDRRPRSRSRRDDYEDDYDDRPRSRRRDDEDDYDDRRRRRRDDRDEDYDDRRRGRRDEDYDDFDDYGADEPGDNKLSATDRMERVHLGLGFIYAKLPLVMLSWTFWAFTFAAPFLIYLSWVCHFLAPAIGLTGSLLCFVVPRKSKTRPILQASFFVDCASALLNTIGFIVMLSGGGQLWFILFLLGGLTTFAGMILFLIFLNKLATFLKDNNMAGEATTILFQYIIVQILISIPLILLYIGMGGRYQVLNWIGYALVISWLALFLKVYIQLLNLIGSLRYRIGVRF